MYDRLRKLTAEMVTPLAVGGLRGRMLVHPSLRKDGRGRTIIFVYGVHASLERFYGVIHFFARFGRVIMPDLPGFGGMEAFYKVGKRPGLDAYGDYLAEFIAQEVPEGKLTLVGLSYGFIVITRMLVRHPELRGRVNMVLSVMGLADGRDLAFSAVARWTGVLMMAAGTWPPAATLARYVFTRPWVLKLSYGPNHPKMKALTAEERPQFIAFEAYLWRCNDMRTYCACIGELLNFRQTGDHVSLAADHIETANDHWLEVSLAAEHIRELYDKVTVHRSALKHHGGTAYDDDAEPAVMIPTSVTKLLESVE